MIQAIVSIYGAKHLHSQVFDSTIDAVKGFAKNLSYELVDFISLDGNRVLWGDLEQHMWRDIQIEQRTEDV